MSDFDFGEGDLGDLEVEGKEDVVGEPLVMVVTEGDDLVCELCEELLFA